jgi:anti-sigma factor RsiW
MKNRHVIKRFQYWHDGRAGQDERREIQLHLDECDDCKRFFEKMTQLMEGIDSARLPHLEPDPFLPARVRAIAGEDRERFRGRAGSPATARPLFGRLGISVLAVAVAVALSIGVVLGSGLSARAASRAEEAALVGAYSDAFSQTDIDSDWESVVVEEEEDSS